MTAPSATVAPWRFRVFYDGECPLCSREIAMLRRLDAGRRRLDLVDISESDFEAGAYGLDQEDLVARIHGMRPDGSILEGVDVFVEVYEAVGLGWAARPARWPGIRWILDRAYVWFARNRLRLTGRAPRTCEAPSPRRINS